MMAMPPLALLTGGLATRMRPMTETVPKALLEVAGEPFIAHQLRLVKYQGIQLVTICAGYLWEMIRDFVGDGTRFGLQVTYSVDQPRLLGTGGALRKALPSLGPHFLVMYGDSWLDAPYRPIVEAFRASAKPALMAVFRNDGQWDKSNVWYDEGQIRLYDKKERLPEMRHIDWGMSVASAGFLAAQPADTPFDLAETYSELSRCGDLAGYEIATRFYEIGSLEGLQETSVVLRKAQSKYLKCT